MWASSLLGSVSPWARSLAAQPVSGIVPRSRSAVIGANGRGAALRPLTPRLRSFSSQKFRNQRFFFFQLVDACVDFLAAEFIQRNVLNDLPLRTYGTDWE